MDFDPLVLGWLALVSIGIWIQHRLRDEAIRDRAALQASRQEDLRVGREEMLEAVDRHQQRAQTHLAIKLGGFGVGIWDLFLPSPAHPSRAVFGVIVALYLLLVMLALDLEGLRDLAMRRAQLLGVPVPRLRQLPRAAWGLFWTPDEDAQTP